MYGVSVVMPVYNAEKYLAEAIESILNQTFSDFEFVIVDDASSDRSVEIIRSFTDSRIVLIQNTKNAGIGGALNQAIDLAKGKYIARMDADDISLPQRLATQFEFLEANPEYVICGSSFGTIGEKTFHKLPQTDDEIKLKMLMVTPFCHPTVMMRAATLKTHSLTYDPQMSPAEDHDLWTRIFAFGKMYNFPESLFSYRVHQNNASLKPRSEQLISGLDFVRQRYVRQFFANAEISETQLRLLLQLFFDEGRWNYDDLRIAGICVNDIVGKHATYPVDAAKVHNFLGSLYFYRCTLATYLGWKSFVLANQFSFVNVSPFRNIKLFLKSIVRYSP